MHGCGKSDDELRAAVGGRIGRLVVDNGTELERLVRMSRPQRPLDVLIRVNSGIEAATHAYVRTAGENSKFGFMPSCVPGIAARIRECAGLRLRGLHAHIGSQIFDAEPYRASLLAVLNVYAELVERGYELSQAIVGGGFGVDARPGATQPDLGAILESLAGLNRDQCRRLGIAAPRLGIEPGRALAAQAGTSLYRVLAAKEQGLRRFVVVDGGLGDNPRPALYGAYHHPSLASRRSEAALRDTTVCGRSCESDELVTEALPEDLAPGDLVAFSTTGAYTFSMASNYNRFPRPAVVFAGSGAHQLAVRRETPEDLLVTDLDAD